LHADLPVSAVFEAPTVRALADRLLTNTVPTREIAAVQNLTPGNGVPLFCIHEVGGTCWPYQVLRDHVDGPIIGIQQVQDADRPEPRSIHDLATRHADRIQATHPSGPYHLLGWSFGGVVAHAVAVELERRGAVVERLVLLDAEPTLSSLAGGAPDRRQLDESIRERGGDEFDGYSRLLDQIVHNVEANVRLYDGHRAGVFGGDVTVFSAQRNDGDRAVVLQRSWRPHAAGDVIVVPVDCAHEDMLSTEALSRYGRQVGRALGREPS
jgi:thioesterase domain-containing protein